MVGAARKAGQVAANTANIVGVELLAAAQGIDFRRPLTSSAKLEAVHTAIRARAARLETDRFMAGDMQAAAALAGDGALPELDAVRRTVWDR